MSGEIIPQQDAQPSNNSQQENPFDAFLSQFEKNRDSLWRRKQDKKVCPQCEKLNALTASKCEECNWTPYYSD